MRIAPTVKSDSCPRLPAVDSMGEIADADRDALLMCSKLFNEMNQQVSEQPAPLFRLELCAGSFPPSWTLSPSGATKSSGSAVIAKPAAPSPLWHSWSESTLDGCASSRAVVVGRDGVSGERNALFARTRMIAGSLS